VSTFRVIVAGSRGICDQNHYEFVREKLDLILRNKLPQVLIINGGCSDSPDWLASLYTLERGLSMKVYLADWDKHGKAAGPIRNREMAENADALVAFWDGGSPGTKNMIEEAEKRGLPVRVFRL
jgi:hypothetical protein